MLTASLKLCDAMAWVCRFIVVVGVIDCEAALIDCMVGVDSERVFLVGIILPLSAEKITYYVLNSNI